MKALWRVMDNYRCRRELVKRSDYRSSVFNALYVHDWVEVFWLCERRGKWLGSFLRRVFSTYRAIRVSTVAAQGFGSYGAWAGSTLWSSLRYRIWEVCPFRFYWIGPLPNRSVSKLFVYHAASMGLTSDLFRSWVWHLANVSFVYTNFLHTTIWQCMYTGGYFFRGHSV